jgi:hypothetical protein
LEKLNESVDEKPGTGHSGAKKKMSWKKRLGRKAMLTLIPLIAEWYMRLYDWATQSGNRKRLTLINIEELEGRVSSHHNPSIICFWHNRIAYGPTAYKAMHGKGSAIMISRSFDGDVIEATVRRFGNIFTVRGGSSRKADQDKGGREALAGMKALADQGYDLSITPDGPLGPRYQVKRGIIDLAKLTGFPIYPVGCSSSRYIEVNSWDRTRVPIPFSRVIYKNGPSMRVPPDADEDMIEAKRAELERVMIELAEFTDQYFPKRK